MSISFKQKGQPVIMGSITITKDSTFRGRLDVVINIIHFVLNLTQLYYRLDNINA